MVVTQAKFTFYKSTLKGESGIKSVYCRLIETYYIIISSHINYILYTIYIT